MTHFNCKNIAIAILFVNIAVLSSCKPQTSAPTENQQLEKQLQNETDSFFSSEILDSDNAPDEDVPCPGATEEQINDPNHPQLVRGSVVAPRIQASFGIPFIKNAHAVPIIGEYPAPNVSVKLMHNLEKPKVVSETTTDALGRFCLKLNANKTFSADHYIQAKVGEDLIRRLSPTQKVAVISAQSEAVFRIYAANRTKFSAKRSTILNLQTIADTQVDTLKPLSADSTIEKSVVLVIQNLESDPRIQKYLR